MVAGGKGEELGEEARPAWGAPELGLIWLAKRASEWLYTGE